MKILRDLARRTKVPILVAYAAAIVLISMKAGEPSELRWWGLAVLFMAWEISPIAFLCLVRKTSIVMALGALIVSVASVAIYWNDMFGPGARSTSALIFIFLPIYQWLIGLAFWGLSFVEERAATR